MGGHPRLLMNGSTDKFIGQRPTRGVIADTHYLEWDYSIMAKWQCCKLYDMIMAPFCVSSGPTLPR